MVDMKQFTKIYADAEEKFVKNVILYGKNGDKYLYSDVDMTENGKIDADTMMELLQKGVLIKYEDAMYVPVFYKKSGSITTVTIATKIATGASTAVEFNSKEYSD